MNDETRPWPAYLGRVLLMLLLALALLWPAAAWARAATVVPVGRAVGIKLYSDGVVVVGCCSLLQGSLFHGVANVLSVYEKQCRDGKQDAAHGKAQQPSPQTISLNAHKSNTFFSVCCANFPAV